MHVLYLEGRGDLVSRLLTGIIGVFICVIGVIDLLSRPHDPPSSLIVEKQDYPLIGEQVNAAFRGPTTQNEAQYSTLYNPSSFHLLFHYN